MFRSLALLGLATLAFTTSLEPTPHQPIPPKERRASPPSNLILLTCDDSRPRARLLVPDPCIIGEKAAMTASAISEPLTD